MGRPDKSTAMSSNFHLSGIINKEDTIIAFLKYGDNFSVTLESTVPSFETMMAVYDSSKTKKL